jgi:hypothetical protein
MEFETVVKVYVGEKEGELDVLGELSDELSERGPYEALNRASAVEVNSAVTWRLAGDAESAAEHAATAARQVQDLLVAEGVDVRVLDAHTAPRGLRQEELACLGAPHFRLTRRLRSETPKPDVRLLEELLAGFPATDAAPPRISRNGDGIEVALDIFARDKDEAWWLADEALGEEFSDVVTSGDVERLT